MIRIFVTSIGEGKPSNENIAKLHEVLKGNFLLENISEDAYAASIDTDIEDVSQIENDFQGLICYPDGKGITFGPMLSRQYISDSNFLEEYVLTFKGEVSEEDMDRVQNTRWIQILEVSSNDNSTTILVKFVPTQSNLHLLSKRLKDWLIEPNLNYKPKG